MEDRMRLLLDRARTAGVRLSEMARRQLALPIADGWTDADIIVSVHIRPRILIAAHAGPGRTAAAGDDLRIIAPESPHLFMDQLYVPGLGNRAATVPGAWRMRATGSILGPHRASIRRRRASTRAEDPGPVPSKARSR
jgi:hypothetical protein